MNGAMELDEEAWRRNL